MSPTIRPAGSLLSGREGSEEQSKEEAKEETSSLGESVRCSRNRHPDHTAPSGLLCMYSQFRDQSHQLAKAPQQAPVVLPIAPYKPPSPLLI